MLFSWLLFLFLFAFISRRIYNFCYMRNLTNETVWGITNYFSFEGKVLEILGEHSGHINDTFHVVTDKRRYILQRLNHNIFKDPEAVMSNIEAVSAALVAKIKERGGAPERECLMLVNTKDGKKLHYDECGDPWRAFVEVEDCRTLLYSEDPDIVFEDGKTLGRFENDLKDFDASKLKETIPHFHDTKSRYRDFEEAKKKDAAGRLESIKEVIARIESYKEYAEDYKGLELHVTHNDPKIPNVLFEKDEKKALCLIDFDTIMPGYVPDDVGDALRSSASKTDEDEPDLSKVGVNIDLFCAFMKGYLIEANSMLDEKTKKYLVYGYLKMTYELVLRFMGDYLNGDTYFHFAYPEHNKVRALCQLTLFEDILAHRDELEEYVKNL
ncbi:MAG TPA: mucin desulfatase [Firmicutes bacterium]|nr:mucin desulfatase [Bacillota bacterium]